MKAERLFTGFLIVWVMYALACLAGVIGIVYVAIHFISKYW